MTKKDHVIGCELDSLLGSIVSGEQSRCVCDKFAAGSMVNRSITIKTGQCHVQRYLKALFERIQNVEIYRADASDFVTGD
jgi:hypothetical protein